MCAKKKSTNDKKTHDTFYPGMEEMMKRCCPTTEEMSRCCSHFNAMGHFDSAGRPDFMAMCEMMKRMAAYKGAQSREG